MKKGKLKSILREAFIAGGLYYSKNTAKGLGLKLEKSQCFDTWYSKNIDKFSTPFEAYFERVKEYRTKNEYSYSDETLEQYKGCIKACFEDNLSVYKCLEFLWFEIENSKIEK